MSLPRTFTLLFFGLVITSFFTDAQADSCLLTSNTTNSNYSLTVSPLNLIKSTLYTVTLSSTQNGSVDFLLQVSASNSTIGNWSLLGTYSNCTNGVSVSSYAINTSNSFIANWTSPSTLSANSVSIRAFLNNSMGVFKIEKILTVAATTTSATTAKTTPKSAGPANDPSSLVLTLCLLVITSKFLS
ncbi:uncharacterized protein LOC143764435 [Ranitomeya variabilis]|uniref:uncharacterized protein LOC143764435 n=1 Tax=Ranitomeya variabilis TaxID=490064 RepID=UPI0040573D88